MALKLDMAKFKKVSSDKHHTVLQHDDGHSIKIAHNALSRENRKALEKLPVSHQPQERELKPKMARGGEIESDELHEQGMFAEGGKIPGGSGSPWMDKQAAKGVEQGAKESGWNPDRWKKNIKEGLKFAEGGEARLESSKGPISDLKEIRDLEEMNSTEEAHDLKGNPKLQEAYKEPKKYAKGGKIEMGGGVRADKYAEGGEVIEDDKNDSQTKAGPVTINVGQPAPSTPEPMPAAAPESASAPEAAPSPEAKPAAPTPQAASAPSTPSPQISAPEQGPSVESGYQKQISGIVGEEAAKAKQADLQAQTIKDQLRPVYKLTEQYQQQVQDLNDERASFQQDIMDKHIDPNHYLGSMNTASLAATTIGLVLGGIGAGLTGGPNPALEFLNKQIDRDIDAQKAELGKRETLLSGNLRQFGNIKDATEMTKVMQLDILSAKLRQAEAVAANPLAKARAQQAIGQLEQQIAPLVQQIATRKMLQEGTPGQPGKPLSVDPAKLIPTVVPEKEQSAAYKELQEAQNMSTAKANLLKSFDKLEKIQTIGNRLTSPLQSKRQVAAIKDPIVAELSKATAGRFTEQDAKFLDSLFPAPGDDAQTIALKKTQADKLVSEKMHFPVLSAYGLEPEKFASTSSDPEAKLSPKEKSFLDFARSNPQDPRSPLILKKLGISR